MRKPTLAEIRAIRALAAIASYQAPSGQAERVYRVIVAAWSRQPHRALAALESLRADYELGRELSRAGL